MSEKKGKKDACYNKVKSRYSVWPSAYASGALVKCRKVGAKNWGKKRTDEALSASYLEMGYLIAEAGLGHKIKKGLHSARIKGGHSMMKAGGKVSPEKGSKPSVLSKLRKRLGSALKKRGSKMLQRAEVDADIYEMKELSPAEQQKRINRARRAVWGKSTKKTNQQIAAQERRLTNRVEKRKEELTTEGRKGTMPKKFSVKSGDKSASGGLTAKGVRRYRAQNPGSKLKTAVTTKPSKLKKGSKAANRRKSFCSRMGGMKKRLTSAKTANDPNSRINKALRKWNC